ncbi:MAG TPA: electron transfer flavoprotein subunit alpha/FixB family protein [Bacillota bacterium]|nr:electron transfer flavoprotein subunit alpha/FixB family protein [Bacillota bacterium]
MKRIVVLPERVTDLSAAVDSCPFAALYVEAGVLKITEDCTACRLCGVVDVVDDNTGSDIDLALWHGIAVYCELSEGRVAPVSYELLGKGRELADKLSWPLYAVMLGDEATAAADEIARYGADSVYLYEHQRLRHFLIEPYTAVLADFANEVKPAVMLFGATNPGRSLAPRLAARLRTGLTADCTVLDIRDSGELVQIRPAFGGNIMAQIVTPAHRPQLATVRYKVFSAPEPTESPRSEIIRKDISEAMLLSNILVRKVTPAGREKSIQDAKILIVAGRGVKDKAGLALLRDLADELGGVLAGTRPLIEAGLFDQRDQIGLSGRTVAPELIITCGVSGSVQFIAGMKNAACIVAINKDDKAPIFNVAHYSLVGDLYEIVPALLEEIREGRIQS